MATQAAIRSDAGRSGSDPSRAQRSGTIPFGPYSTWYRVTEPPGEVTGDPIVVLHGGPGMAHDYCGPMDELSDSGRIVVQYDQLGCGRSTHLPDAPPHFWSAGLFVDELANLLDALDGLGHPASRVHLLGQSWGGMLAPEFALAHPERVSSLVLADSPASMRRWVLATGGLKAQLPDAVRAALDTHEDAGTTDDDEYLAGVDEFYRRFMCRLDPWPECLRASFAQLETDPTVYRTMIGSSEFHVTGSLRDWTLEGRLSAIAAPTLVLAGEFDEAQPIAWRPFVDELPDVRSHVFEGASHTPHLECPEQFLAVVTSFLADVEARA